MKSIEQAILDEFYYGQGTVHIDDLLDMFRSEFPDEPFDSLHQAMQRLEEEGSIKLEGSSGYYHQTGTLGENTMKISKAQLKRIIREEYSRLQHRGLIREMTDDEALKQYQDGWDAPDVEDARNESENRNAFQQLEWSLQTLVDQLGHYGATERVIEALMSCDGGPDLKDIEETVHEMR